MGQTILEVDQSPQYLAIIGEWNRLSGSV